MKKISFLRKIRRKIKDKLPKSLRDFIDSKKFFFRRFNDYKLYISLTDKKKAIEIGGPSLIFKTYIPIYPKLKSLDGVNFSEETMWEGKISTGKNYNYYGGKNGFQFISEATDLKCINSSTYECLLSSHCLEHIANPIKALTEWFRILTSKGVMILILPRKDGNFDRKRTITSFEHLLKDYKENILEDDLTHYDEIIKLHEVTLDPGLKNIDELKYRGSNNSLNRGFHHHVFNKDLIEKTLSYVGFDIINYFETTHDLITLAVSRKKP